MAILTSEEMIRNSFSPTSKTYRGESWTEPGGTSRKRLQFHTSRTACPAGTGWNWIIENLEI